MKTLFGNKTFRTAACMLLILAVIPLARVYLFHQELRELPLAEPRAEADDAARYEAAGNDRETAAYEYGYYPDDHWMEKQAGLYVRAGESGWIHLDIYYPFAIVGGETGRVSVNGQPAQEFTLTGENMTVSVRGTPDEVNHIVIESDFAREPGDADKRALAFVLKAIRTE